MKKILPSVFILLLCSLNTVAYAEVDSLNTKKTEEIEIEKYSHLDIGISGFSLQVKYSHDLSSYNELGLKVSSGGLVNVNSPAYLMDTGIDISLEDKAYFMKSNKYYSKSNAVLTAGGYIKTFAGLTNSFIMKALPFLVVGTGIGYDTLKNNIGFGIGLDVGTTLQMKNNSLAGIIFIRPEMNFRMCF